MARDLSELGIPVFRFDYQGMGDSEGEPSTFENVQDDIKAAIDAFFTQVSGIQKVVIWGLCDGASAACFYAYTDPRVVGLALVNPWVTTEVTKANTYLKHYYFQQLLHIDFWRRLVSGKVHVSEALREFAEKVWVGRFGSQKSTPANIAPDFREMMYEGLVAFKGVDLVVSSGNDLTAMEFVDLITTNGRWRKLFSRKNVTRSNFTTADHTFSRREWLRELSEVTGRWVRSL